MCPRMNFGDTYSVAAIISLGRCSYTHRHRKLHNVEGKTCESYNNNSVTKRWHTWKQTLTVLLVGFQMKMTEANGLSHR